MRRTVRPRRATAPVAPCGTCGAPGPVRVVDPDGATQLCVLHAMVVLARAESGVHIALLVRAGGDR